MVNQASGDQDRQIEALRNRWLEACLAYDVVRAEDAINQAFALYPVETVCFEILQKGVRQIGEMWHQGRASVQQEHFTSAVAVRRVETLITSTPNATREMNVLTGCPAGEWHNFPILLLTLLLRRRGVNVLYLGANIPLEQIEHTTAITHPSLVVLSAQQLDTAVSIRDVARIFQQMGVPMAYGGLIFNRIPQLRAKIPAYFLGESLEDAMETVEQLLTFPGLYQAALKESLSDPVLAKNFANRSLLIEAEMLAKLKEAGLPATYMADVTHFFTTRVTAALELGDLDFILPDLEWVKKLLSDRQIPAERLTEFMSAYQQVIESELGEGGSKITEWIASYLSSSGRNQ
jgi:methanogenic corrinoid protein MtbC1